MQQTSGSTSLPQRAMRQLFDKSDVLSVCKLALELLPSWPFFRVSGVLPLKMT